MLELETASALPEVESWIHPTHPRETTKLYGTSTVSGERYLVIDTITLMPRTFVRKISDGSDRVTWGYVTEPTNAGKYLDEEWLVGLREFKEFRTRAIGALEQEPVEDGMKHPVEEVLAEAFRLTDQAPGWVHRVFVDLLDNPALAAGLLRCLGRIGYGAVGPGGAGMVIIGLGHKSAAVREAAIVAIEHWARPELTSLLDSHRDPVQWLADYVRQVVRDLSDR